MPTITEDRSAIIQLLHRYNHAFDGSDPDGWANCFTQDAVFDISGHVTTGRAALRAQAAAAGEGHGVRHLLANPVIDVDGDIAYGKAYVVFVQHGIPDHIGVYADEYHRTPEGWRIAKRVYTRDPISLRPR